MSSPPTPNPNNQVSSNLAVNDPFRYFSLNNQAIWLENAYLRDKIDGIPIDPEHPAPSACKKFHPFMQLPPELRAKIWVWTALHPRVVAMSLSENTNGPDEKPGIISHTIVPALLHVHRESRYVGLRFYDVFPTAGGEVKTYINWAYDTLLGEHQEIVGEALTSNPTIIQNCMHLAVDYQTERALFFSPQLLQTMPNLQTVSAVEIPQLRFEKPTTSVLLLRKEKFPTFESIKIDLESSKGLSEAFKQDFLESIKEIKEVSAVEQKKMVMGRFRLKTRKEKDKERKERERERERARKRANLTEEEKAKKEEDLQRALTRVDKALGLV